MSQGGEFAPFLHPVGTGRPVLWMDSPGTQELHAAVAGLYADVHPYATAMQVQALSGEVVTVRRVLPALHAAYPSISTPPSVVRDPAGQDPYDYQLTRYSPDSVEYSGMTVEHWRPQTSRVKGKRFIVTGENETKSAELLDPVILGEEVEAMTAVLHTGSANTAETASLMRWSEVQGMEADAFHTLIETALHGAGVEPGTLTYPLGMQPKEAEAGQWGLEGAIITPDREQDPRIDGQCVAAYITFEENDVMIRSVATYVRDGSMFSGVARSIQFVRVGGEQEFLSPQERTDALEALDWQLHPDNLDFVHARI